MGGAKQTAMQKQVLIFFCGGGAYSHYYIIEWNIPQAAFNISCFQTNNKVLSSETYRMFL